MQIFQSLKTDHEMQRQLCKNLLDTHGDTEQRRSLFRKLRTEMHSHATAEERHFYIPLIEHDETQEQARHSIAEHKELDDLLEELDDTDYSSASWMATFKHLADRLIHHLDEEEREIFPIAERILGDTKSSDLADDFIVEKARRSS